MTVCTHARIHTHTRVLLIYRYGDKSSTLWGHPDSPSSIWEQPVLSDVAITTCLYQNFIQNPPVNLSLVFLLFLIKFWEILSPNCAGSVVQSCPILWDPMDCSPPGSSVHGISQARILHWVAISSSRGSYRPRDRTLVSYVSCIGRQILYHWATWESSPPNHRMASFQLFDLWWIISLGC